MNASLVGEVALVTGAERGIGRALAVGLGHAGASVIVNYFSSKSDAVETVRLVNEAGSKAIAVKGDVGKPADVQRLIARAVKHFGKLDVVINNAGIHIYKPLKEFTSEEWDRTLATNLKGPFLTSKAAAELWRRKKIKGRIVNITSAGAQIPFPNSAAYNSSKGGLLMLTRQLALELGPDGIRVNAIAPGVVHTNMNDFLMRQPKQYKAWSEAIPMKRVAKPNDLIEAAVFLSSKESDYITGQQIAVDGGWSMTVQFAVTSKS